ncbi:MAG: hypothetical protein AB8I08_10410 [Sandaracinaceae bacterium]
MTKRVMILMAALGLFTSGCELAVPLIAAELGGNDDIEPSSAALSVRVEAAEGSLRGQALSPEMLAATGDRHGAQLSFAVQVGGPDTMMHVVVPQADGSSVNPYEGDGFEGEGPFFGEGDAPFFEDAGAFLPQQGLAPEQGARFMVCDGDDCFAADDFDIQIEQTPDGRVASFEGTFGEGERARVVMRYTEDD